MEEELKQAAAGTVDDYGDEDGDIAVDGTAGGTSATQGSEAVDGDVVMDGSAASGG